MNNTKDNVMAGLVIAWITFLFGFAFAIVAGWVMNLVQLIAFTGSEDIFGALEVLRVVGVVIIPIGAVMGWVG